MNILRIDASMRKSGSVSRELTDRAIASFQAGNPDATVTVRDLADTPLPQVDETWIGANFTDEADRSDEQKAVLAQSDSLVEELVAADTIVIGVPVYNFGIPAALKAWIDLIARARKTFRYSENGPVGLLTGKKVVIALASGGVEMDSAYDFATPYLRHVLGFVGLHDVTVLRGDALMMDKTGEKLGSAQASADSVADTLKAAA